MCLSHGGIFAFSVSFRNGLLHFLLAFSVSFRNECSDPVSSTVLS